jgi:hypothetical protein
MMDERQTNDGRLVTADMLQDLPEPVQRYMAYTGVVGKPWIDTVRVQHAGRFRLGQDRPWMPMRAVQTYTTGPPGFFWKARFKMAGLWLLSAQDRYEGGQGHMFGKMAGLWTMFDARGEEIDQGTMLRYLSEMIWIPTALLGENITWQGIDDHSAQVTFSDCGKSVSARMAFDSDGKPVNFVTRRYREINGGYSLDPWSTPMVAYGERAGLNLPVHGQAVWNLPSGDLAYWDGEVTEVEYNQPIELDEARSYEICAVIDRYVIRPGIDKQLLTSLEHGLLIGEGFLSFQILSEGLHSDPDFYAGFACPEHGTVIYGGRVVAQGQVDDLLRNPESLTGRYLRGAERIPLPASRRCPNGHNLGICGARQNNLQDVDVTIPLGVLVCITGVSGSGKSSLIHEILYKKAALGLSRQPLAAGQAPRHGGHRADQRRNPHRPVTHRPHAALQPGDLRRGL